MRNVKLLIPALALAAAVSGVQLAGQQPSQPAPDVPAPSQPATTQPAPQPGTQPETQAPQPTSGQQQSTSPAVPAPSTANAPEVTNAELRPITGELVSKLDTKNAKNGDQVVLKTTEKATFADGVVLPKGSKIMGHVTDVQAHDEANPNSKVAIQFDQAEVKGGQTLPIRSVLQSVEPASGSDAAAGGSPFGTGSAPSVPATSGSAPGASTSTGSAGGASASPGGAAPTPMPQGSTAGTASASSGASTASNGYPSAGTVIARQGNIEIKTSAIPGVLIAGNSNGQPFSNASGALLGARQNVHLDGGTKVTLAVSNANAKASNNR